MRFPFLFFSSFLCSFSEILLPAGQCFNIHFYDDVGIQSLSIIYPSGLSFPARCHRVHADREGIWTVRHIHYILLNSDSALFSLPSLSSICRIGAGLGKKTHKGQKANYCAAATQNFLKIKAC